MFLRLRGSLIWLVVLLAFSGYSGASAQDAYPAELTDVNATRTVSNVFTTDHDYTIVTTGTDAPANAFLTLKNVGTRPIVAPQILVEGKDWSSLDRILEQILKPGMTDREKAFAIWQFARTNFYHWWPASELSWDSHDPVKLFNGYGYGFCSVVAASMSALFERAGLPARIWNPKGYYQHVVPEVYYDGSWHMFDADQDIIYYRWDNATVAGVEELIDDPALVSRLGPAFTPWAQTYAGTPKTAQRPAASYYFTGHTTEFTLRPQESLSLFWNQYEGNHDDTLLRSIIPAPPELSSAKIVSQLTFSTTNYVEWVVQQSGARSVSQDGLWPPFGPITVATPADVVYRVQSPYPIVRAELAFDMFASGAGNQIAVFASQSLTTVTWLGPELANFAYRTSGLFVEDENLASYYSDSALPTLHLQNAALPASLTLKLTRVSSEIPVYAGGTFYRNGTSDAVTIAVSTDGVNWSPAWQATTTGTYFAHDEEISDQLADALSFFVRYEFRSGTHQKWTAGMTELRITGVAPLLDQQAWQMPELQATQPITHAVIDLTSQVANPGAAANYVYYIRIAATAAQTPTDVGLIGFALTTTAQVSTQALPSLQLGANEVTYRDDSAEPVAIQVIHGWDETTGSHPPVPPPFATPAEQVDATAPFTLTWAQPDDPDGDMLAEYHVQVCDHPTCDWPINSLFDVDIPADEPGWQVPHHALLEPGRSYYWRVKASDSNGQWGEYGEVWSFSVAEVLLDGLEIHVSPVITFGQPGLMSARIAAGSHVSYTWDFGDGAMAAGATVTHTYQAAGTYQITATAANPVGVLTSTAVVQVEAPLAGLSAAAPEVAAAGQPVVMSAQVSTGTNVTYTWHFGDGTQAAGTPVVHAYQAPGAYQVTVVAANLVGVLTLTKDVTVYAPIAGLAIAAPPVAAAGSPVTLAAQATGGSNILYTWQLGDGRQANGAAITHTYAAPGVYTVTLTAVNPLGTDATARALQVDVPPAGLAIVAPEVNTAGLPLTLQAQMAAGTNLTYSWVMGDGTSLTGPAVVHTYPAAGVYSVTVTAANALAIISATVSLQVDTPIVDLTLTAPPLVAVGQPISLTAQVAAGSHAVYRWDFGDGSYAIGPAVEHAYQDPGIYALAVTASNPLGYLFAGSQVRVEEFIVTDHLWLPIIGAP